MQASVAQASVAQASVAQASVAQTDSDGIGIRHHAPVPARMAQIAQARMVRVRTAQASTPSQLANMRAHMRADGDIERQGDNTIQIELRVLPLLFQP